MHLWSSSKKKRNNGWKPSEATHRQQDGWCGVMNNDVTSMKQMARGHFRVEKSCIVSTQTGSDELQDLNNNSIVTFFSQWEIWNYSTTAHLTTKTMKRWFLHLNWEKQYLDTINYQVLQLDNKQTHWYLFSVSFLIFNNKSLCLKCILEFSNVFLNEKYYINKGSTPKKWLIQGPTHSLGGLEARGRV